MGRKEQFDELLKELKLSDEDKALIRQIEERSPGSIADAMLRQADYDRSMNENKDKLAKAEEWITWADRNVPKFNQMSTEYDGLVKETNELKAKIASGEVNDVQAAELQTRILKEVESKLAAAGGNVSETALNKMIEDATNKFIGAKAAELETKFTKETLPQNMAFIADVLDFAQDYRGEFGEKIDRAAFIKHIGTCGKETVKDAYEDFVAVKRLEAKHKKEVEDAATKAREDERTKLANQNFPGSTAVVPQAGPMTEYIRSTNPAPVKPAAGEQPVVPGPALGDGSLAALAAAELRAEGKG